jgi:hypothetical protein
LHPQTAAATPKSVFPFGRIRSEPHEQKLLNRGSNIESLRDEEYTSAVLFKLNELAPIQLSVIPDRRSAEL